MNLAEAKLRTLGVFGGDGPYKLLGKRQVRMLHRNTLLALWRAVCEKTCDEFGGYHSDGCKQLMSEYWRRKQEAKKPKK